MMNLDFENLFDLIKTELSELSENPLFITMAIISYALTFVTDFKRLYDNYKDNHKTERKFKRIQKKHKRKQPSENLELFVQ